MRLRRVEFKNVLCEPGALGFTGEGEWYHNAARMLGVSWADVTFVSQAVTAAPWPGINPGIDEFLPQWVERARRTPSSPFLISFVAISGSPRLRLDEAKRFVEKSMKSYSGCRAGPASWWSSANSIPTSR